MDARNNIAQDLFYKIRSRFSGLKLGEETGQITINPEEARFFDFDYMEGKTPIGHVSISLAEPNSMKVYFSHGITEGMDDGQKNNWYSFLKELRQFAKRRLLSFDTRDIAKDNLDKRDYEFLAQNAQPKQQQNTIQKPVGESIMAESNMYGSRLMSYQNLLDTRLIIKHNQAVMDDAAPGARTRHISALFVENQDGERFKYPFIHLAGARAMQRHVANGGVPYDDLGKSIIRMSEEIAALKSFGGYVVRNDLMNSETNSVVERSTAYLNGLREQIKGLAKQSHYEAYRENFQAQDSEEVPQDVVEDFKEKFTVKSFREDIASVFPVLYKLMKEGNTIGYDDIVGLTQEELATEDFQERKTIDPFAKFENWVMGLGEDSAITSQDPEEQQSAIESLQHLVNQSFPAGVDGTNAIESLKGLIEDPELYQRIKSLAAEDSTADIREQVQGWLQLNAPEVLEQLDFGDFQPAAPAEPAAVAPEVAPQEGIEEAKGYAYDLDTDYETDSAVIHFNMGQDGKPVVTHVLLGRTDITKALDQEYLADLAGWIDLESMDDIKPTGNIAYDQGIMVDVHIEYDIFGSHRPATYDDPAEYPEIDGARITVSTPGGQPVEVDDTDFGPKGPEWVEEKIWDDANAKKDDYDDYDGYDDYDESAEQEQEQHQQGMNVNELAEFIKSFYDKESNTFPKGPEGVCTMVGKKFGEQAEQVARKFVERMAPQQNTHQNPELAELARIKELSGMR